MCQRQVYESAVWTAREQKGPENTLIFLEEKVSKNDLNGKIFFLSLSHSVSWTNIALHVMQRQRSSMLGMSNLGGKVLTLVLTLVFWLLCPLFLLSSPLQHGTSVTATTKPPQTKPLPQEDWGVLGGSHQQPQLPVRAMRTNTYAQSKRDYFIWKGPTTIIQANCLTTSGPKVKAHC